ncbi:MAG: GDP-mannose 4,6-dehydratase [Anaerolineae bacterium]
MEFLSDFFKGANILITGGLGFIGSNLAIALVRQGAKVTVADAMISGYGGNLFNISSIKDDLQINFCDIRSVEVMNYLVEGRDYIFHLAGQVDHILSQSDPFLDIDMNIRGTAVVLEACKHHNPTARMIYCGTRGEYGAATKLPVNESAPTHPRGIYEISNLTAQQITKVYHDIHGIKSVMLRLTNTYGPRAQMQHARYGVVNWFVRLAIDGERIKVFGDGLIRRDFLYVDDCVEAMLKCAATEEAYGELFNVGRDVPTTFKELADTIVQITGAQPWEYTPFSPERAAQEPGDFFSDITKIRNVAGWEPKTTLVDGLTKTVDYYRQYKTHYW